MGFASYFLLTSGEKFISCWHSSQSSPGPVRSIWGTLRFSPKLAILCERSKSINQSENRCHENRPETAAAKHPQLPRFPFADHTFMHQLKKTVSLLCLPSEYFPIWQIRQINSFNARESFLIEGKFFKEKQVFSRFVGPQKHRPRLIRRCSGGIYAKAVRNGFTEGWGIDLRGQEQQFWLKTYKKLLR